MFKHLQKLGKAFMLPIAILPAAVFKPEIESIDTGVNWINCYRVHSCFSS